MGITGLGSGPLAANPDKESRPRQIEEVIVSATKREQNLRDIAGSISRLGGEELARRGVQNIDDFVKLTPGVNVTEAAQTTKRVTIRGISQEPFTNPTTGTLFDNIPFSDVFVPFVTLDPHPFDLQSVEVLKGPQGTLFGASALNGAVRYVPEKPKLGEWGASYYLESVEIEHGEDMGKSAALAVNVPIGSEDRMALRLVGLDREMPGYTDNLHEDVQRRDSNTGSQRAARVLFKWDVSDAWEVGFVYAWQETLIDDAAVTDNREGRMESRTRPSLGPTDNTYDLTNLTVSYDIEGWGQFISDTAYVGKDGQRITEASANLINPPPGPLSQLKYFSDSETYSQELRFVSSPELSSSWSFITGLFAFQQDIVSRLDIPLNIQSFLNIPGVTELIPQLLSPVGGLGLGLDFDENGDLLLARVDSDVRAKEVALFAEVTHQLGERFELLLGGRYYRTESGGVNELSGFLSVAASQARERRIDDSIRESGLSPKLSLTFHANDDFMTYLTISRGFRVGGIQVSSPVVQDPDRPAPSTFKSDSLWNYEVGTRTSWFDRTLLVDLSAYYIRWDDPQTIVIDSANTGNFIDNVGGAKGQGVEAALQYLTPFGLSLSVSAAYTDTVSTAPFQNSGGEEIPPGSQWPLASRWQTATTLDYRHYEGAFEFNAGVTHTYLSSAPQDFSSRLEVFGFSTWNLNFGLRNEALKWLPDILVSVNNLTNEKEVVGVAPFLTTGSEAVGYNQPRTITMRVSGEF